jgi:outer membrane protein, heavy metal efflux system
LHCGVDRDLSEDVFGEKPLKIQIVSLLLVISTTVEQIHGSESRGTADPLAESTTLSLDQLIPLVLKQNPMIRSAREKWRAARDRIPQAGAWDDLKIGTGSVLGRFVSIPANAFTDQSLTIEQMIPLSGKNRSKERVVAAEALAVFEEARRQELDVVAKAKATYYQISNLYQLLDINNADEASLVQSLDATRAKFEVGTQTQADLLLADNERQKDYRSPQKTQC